MKSYHNATSILNTLIKHARINKSWSHHFSDTQHHIVTAMRSAGVILLGLTGAWGHGKVSKVKIILETLC